MHTVTESIYSGRNIVIPLADVQHIEKHNPGGLIIITKHTRWDTETGNWANNAWIGGDEADAFMAAWCRYRSELEADTLADLRGDAGSILAIHDKTIDALKRA